MPDQKPTSQGSVPPPEATFGDVVQTFGLQALLACGKIMNPITQKYEKNIELARFHIGVLQMLREKTKGNLTADETMALDEILHQARMAFLDAGGFIQSEGTGQ